MINNIVASVNAGYTKVAGQSPSSKSKKKENKVINLDNLEKVQAISEIEKIGGKIIRYDESLIQCPKYNKKGKSVNPKRNYIDIQA